MSNRDNMLYSSTGGHLPFLSWEIILSLLVFGFIAGARYNVGVDYLNYLEEFTQAQISGASVGEDNEPGFKIIANAFAHSGLHYFFYFAFWAILQLFFIYKAFEDEKYLLPFISLWIMLGPYFLSWMNGIRQCVATCFFVYLTRYIKEKKILPFLIGIILASTIHRSALLLLPFGLLCFISLAPDKKWLNYAILLGCIALGAVPYWISLTSEASTLLKMIGYEDYSERYVDIISLDRFRTTAWGPSRIGLLLVDIIVLWIYPLVRSSHDNPRKGDVLFILYFIGICLYNLFANTSHIFLRPIEHLTIFRLPLTAYTLYYLKTTKRNFLLYLLSFIMFTYIYIIVYKSVYMPNEVAETNLYKFFF